MNTLRLDSLLGIATLTTLAAFTMGCNDAKACYEKGDEKACNSICETGTPEAKPACFEMRAREVAACADGAGDCTKACASWKNAQIGGDDEIKNIYVAKLGSEAKVAAIKGKCK
jgi:hypothetical protein